LRATTPDRGISRRCEKLLHSGLDPNNSFNNVELVTTEKIGLQTTTYASSIYKYYVTCNLMLKNLEEKHNAEESIATDKNKRSK
jgi:hypothetical protein